MNLQLRELTKENWVYVMTVRYKRKQSDVKTGLKEGKKEEWGGMRVQMGVLPQPAPTMNNEITTALCVCVCVRVSAWVCGSRCKLAQLKQTCLWIPECQACSHAYHVCAQEAGMWLYVSVTSKEWVHAGVSGCLFTHTHRNLSNMYDVQHCKHYVYTSTVCVCLCVCSFSSQII